MKGGSRFLHSTVHDSDSNMILALTEQIPESLSASFHYKIWSISTHVPKHLVKFLSITLSDYVIKWA